MSSVSQLQARKVNLHCHAALCWGRCSPSMLNIRFPIFGIVRLCHVVNHEVNEGLGLPVQVGLGHSLLLQKSFAGHKLAPMPFTMKPASRQVDVMAFITTQRLKAKSQKGTQRIAPPRKPNAPKKTGTQMVKPPSVGTQVNRKVHPLYIRPVHDAPPSRM